jgi:hypothetical protein
MYSIIGGICILWTQLPNGLADLVVQDSLSVPMCDWAQCSITFWTHPNF